MYDDAGLTSTGTAFFYFCENSWFLITNWHNLSGRHFLSKEPLSRPPKLPTHIEAHLSAYIASNLSLADNSFTTVSQRVDIYRDMQPLWFEHPTLGSLCDVIALPMERPASCPQFMHNAANLIGKTRIPVLPGGNAFVIGFPQSLSVGFGLPLWKSGFIASEPHYGITTGGAISSIGGLSGGTELPAFFLDTQTREGMSGAPVFASHSGTWNTNQPYEKLDSESAEFWSSDDIAIAHSAIEFIGCYSARIGKAEEGAALGLCWPENVLHLICSSKVVGAHPQVSSVAP